MNAYGQKMVLTSTSPASAINTVGATIEGLADYSSLLILSTITGATGGVLDVYLQVSPDGETVPAGTRIWADYIHYPQAAAAAAASTYIIGVSRDQGTGTSPVFGAVTTGTTPLLGANVVVGGDFGKAMRVLYKGGASTSAGAAQTIVVYGSIRA